ncbi:glycosyltransferase family 4 protein [Gluconobacter oxydans]|uniref:glycosyltransferase family 4 protein n=1 Tax=Gluconobacter oxydans TaxID=442 RepID=UPI0007999BC8|nr:glycosyltransferase family 1 protein [Gluconobacter oxydans]KXV66359.1 mannosyltransferase [Gluconobacter oxydans]
MSLIFFLKSGAEMAVIDPVYLLDISRLLDRAKTSGPTGIDRVELAYAEYLLKERPEQTLFCAWHPWGWIGGIRTDLAAAFIQALSRQWAHTGKVEHTIRLKRKIRLMLLWQPLPRRSGIIHLLLSHHHLMKRRAIEKLLERTSGVFVPMVHDVIPLNFPEYGRPREQKRHQQRMDSVARLADGILVPSEAVRQDLKTILPEGNKISIWAVPHGTPSVGFSEDNSIVPKRPFFVYLSTIEPRKNHLMLLHAWRKMVETAPDNAPILVLVGKRGWENENIIDLLDRSRTLRPYLLEYNNLSDGQVSRLLEASRALVFPSLTEGYGLPVAEALSMKVPVICSDIPVLREVGGQVPDYIDPLNGTAWADIIMEYTGNGPRRQAQLQRMHMWKPFTWKDSVSTALNQIEISLCTAEKTMSGKRNGRRALY